MNTDVTEENEDNKEGQNHDWRSVAALLRAQRFCFPWARKNRMFADHLIAKIRNCE
jgi:hypothetical protein